MKDIIPFFFLGVATGLMIATICEKAAESHSKESTASVEEIALDVQRIMSSTIRGNGGEARECN